MDIETPSRGVAQKHSWPQIITTVIGAVILGLQGINISEVTQSNLKGDQRMEVLQQLLSISKSMDESLHNQTQILENGARLLDADDKAFQRQTQILDTLRGAIAERKELLEQHLEKEKQKPDDTSYPPHAPTPEH